MGGYSKGEEDRDMAAMYEDLRESGCLKQCKPPALGNSHSSKNCLMLMAYNFKNHQKIGERIEIRILHYPAMPQ